MEFLQKKSIENLKLEEKISSLIYIFNSFGNNQINSLNEINPDLLDDSIDINIFNLSSIGEYYLVNQIWLYLVTLASEKGTPSVNPMGFWVFIKLF